MSGEEPRPAVVRQDARAEFGSEVNQAGGDLTQYRTTYAGAPPDPPAVLHTLPRDVAGFTGRDAELQRLLDAAGPARVVAVHTVDGMPGVGKTALVTRAAHLLAERFPDGQQFVDLHGHTPGQLPADPFHVLDTVLTDLEVLPQHMPPTLEGRSRLWRDRLSGKKLLLILDDAAEYAQIAPLLPGSGPCLTLVTSRRRLIALDGALPLPLDTLPPGEAALLFTRLARRTATGAEAAAVAEITRLCGCLPLALVLLAGRLAHHPSWTVTQLATDFALARDRLGELVAGDRAVTAAFAMSYQDLPPDRQRLFRRLGLHPGLDVDAHAAAALDAVPPAAARRALEALYTDHLIDEPSPGRYRLHDLLRAFARALARDAPADDEAGSVARLLDHYQVTVEAADRHLARFTRPKGPLSGPLPATAPVLSSRDAAVAWMRTERANLLACLDHAAVNGQWPRVVRLTAALAVFLRQDGPWQQAAQLHQRAAVAAERGGDRLGQADALHDLGWIRQASGDYRTAAELYEQALALFHGLGNRQGEANVLGDLGRVRYMTGDYPAAGELYQRALPLFRGLGDPQGEANTLNGLGWVRQTTGGYRAAAWLHQRASVLFRDLGNRRGEAYALNGLGRVRNMTGDHRAAAELYRRSLSLFQDLGDRQGEANARNGLGRVLQAAGDHRAAAGLFRQALPLFHDLGDRQGETEVLTSTGALLAETTGPREALAVYQRALCLARQVRRPLNEARVLEGTARCQTRIGERETALANLREAVGTYQHIGAAEAKQAAAYLADLESAGSGGAVTARE
ncbi:hypothetical protein A6A06_25615 [Streptomyces sp. CB02923]|uniref:ATP-binding protein n=1 Tax=Streptomyces sp. CB02923 TaxID=1718985 RepID=UPI00093F35E0|nr:tetratricopeptide repeat protein [Streptomyces sp. CB02923]OKH98982.1 hypothetical protein A6A06_25615 [Streptomyces sp. CB02923]